MWEMINAWESIYIVYNFVAGEFIADAECSVNYWM